MTVVICVPGSKVTSADTRTSVMKSEGFIVTSITGMADRRASAEVIATIFQIIVTVLLIVAKKTSRDALITAIDISTQ